MTQTKRTQFMFSQHYTDFTCVSGWTLGNTKQPISQQVSTITIIQIIQRESISLHQTGAHESVTSSSINQRRGDVISVLFCDLRSVYNTAQWVLGLRHWNNYFFLSYSVETCLFFWYSKTLRGHNRCAKIFL